MLILFGCLAVVIVLWDLIAAAEMATYIVVRIGLMLVAGLVVH